MASNTCITNKVNSLSSKYNDLYRVVACNSKKINECYPNDSNGITGPTGPVGATGEPGIFDPNNLQLKCGLTGTITPNNAVCVELEKTTPSVNNSLPNAPSEGFRRDHIIAEDPCNPIATNFFLTVNHSPDGYGSVIGYNNTLPNNATVRGSVISGGESNSIASGSEFTTIAGGRENVISGGEASSILSGGKNTIKSGNFCSISSGFNNGITTSNNSNINGGSQNFIMIGCTGSTVSGGTSNRIEVDVNNSNISGGTSNRIEVYVNNSNISGGKSNGIENKVNSSNISGGESNGIRSSKYSNISGGIDNKILTGSTGSNISGGKQNVISTSDYSNISGGQSNVLNEVKNSGVLSGSSNGIKNSDTSSIGGGTKHVIQNNVTSSNINSGVNNKLTDNVSLSFIGGGTKNTIREDVTSCIIGGGMGNLIENEIKYSVISSGKDNKIVEDVDYSGIFSGHENIITKKINDSAILSGFKNEISSATGTSSINSSVIGGGSNNKITLNFDGKPQGLVISGGDSNRIENDTRFDNISGGQENVIDTAYNCNIGGGQENEIHDTEHSVIVGGRENVSLRLCPTGPTGPIPRYTKIPGGYQASSFSHGQHVHSSGRIYKDDAWDGKTSPQPDTRIPNSISQTSEYIMKTYIPKAGTEQNTPLPVFSIAVLDDGNNFNNSYIYVPPNSAWGFEAIVSIQCRKNNFESLPEYSGMLKYCGTVFRDNNNMIVVRSTDPSCQIYSDSNISMPETQLEFLSSGDTGPSVTPGPGGGGAIDTQPSSYCSGGLGVVVVNNNPTHDKYVSILIKTVEISRPPVPYFGPS